MLENGKISPITERPLIAKLLILGGLFFVGSFIGQIFGLIIVMFMTGMTHTSNATQLQSQIQALITHPKSFPNGWYALMALQWFSALFSFVGASCFYWRFIERRRISDFSSTRVANPLIWIAIIVLIVAAIPFNDFIYNLNKSMVLPETLKGVETWMRESEDQLAEMTRFLTSFHTFEQFVIAMAVIAGLAALGEEITFRGVIQNLLIRHTRNPHLSIWISAIIFSAIHAQFYGFVPRMMLGALFGYLYYWTKNLWIPVVAHFVNNGFTILMIYLYQIKVTETDIEKMESPSFIWVLVSVAITSAIIYWFYQGRVSDRNKMREI